MLWRLGQGIEFARVKAARHQVIARPFGGALNQDGRLYLNKPLGIEEIADILEHPVAKQQIFLHPCPAQVEVAILKAEVFIHLNIFIDVERRCLRRVKYIGTPGDNLNITGGQFGVLGSRRAEGNLATNPDEVVRVAVAGNDHVPAGTLKSMLATEIDIDVLRVILMNPRTPLKSIIEFTNDERAAAFDDDEEVTEYLKSRVNVASATIDE